MWQTLLTLVASAATVTETPTSSAKIQATGVPAGFDELTREREAFVDVYFGGRKIGEARVSTRPGFIRFRDPDQVLAFIPNAKRSPDLTNALRADLPTNTSHLCPMGVSRGCGTLSPDLVGVIFNQDQFRLDLFLNPQWLELSGSTDEEFLPDPTAPLSFASATGLAISGSTESSTVYNLQNRSIVALRSARVRSDTLYASELGFVVDSLVAELDQPNFRYSGGLFWAPGVDLTGQRRILGIGVGTQFDTRADREQIRGTPLILFVAETARVEVLIDGRLVGSAIYEAGNNVIDTSSLPDGAYTILLRIHERGGAVREERRFFVKNAQIAPVGQPLYFGYVGMLANTDPGKPISVSNDIFYQFGMARRLSGALAVDVTVIGTPKKPLLEAGGWLLTRVGRMRIAGLVSLSGDRAVLAQVMSEQTGRFSVNFDLRRIWSRNDEPLIPLSTTVDSFQPHPRPDLQRPEGSYTQISGSVGYRLGSAYVAMIGSLRRDEGVPSDYSIGPNISWPILNRNGLQLTVHADAQVTRTTTAGYAGVRLFFNSGQLSVFSTTGRRTVSSDGGPRNSRAVGGVTGTYTFRDARQTEISLAAGGDRDLASTTAHALGLVYSRFGTARGEVLHDFEGNKRTQYALTLQTGSLITRDDVLLGGRSLEESALIASVTGNAKDAEFEVLVNDQPRGRLKTGERLPIFLQAYRAYRVRLRPVSSAPVWFEAAAREISLYPGNVENARWQVEQQFIVFGQAMRPDGSAVADAVVTSKRGLGQSDANGYFQIETSGNESLSFTTGHQEACMASVGSLELSEDFVALGKVICR